FLSFFVVTLPAAAEISISIEARSVRPGELVVLTITTSAPADDVQVRAFGHEIRAFASGPLTWRALIGVDLDAKAGTEHVRVELRGGPGLRRTDYPLRIRPKRFPTRTLTVDEAFVTPPPEVQPRIEREAEELRRIWRQSAPERRWAAPFVRP